MTSAFIFLLVSPICVFRQPARALASPGPLTSRIAWVTEPLPDVFRQIQYRLLGIVSGVYLEPSYANLTTMREVFSLVESGISKNDTSAIFTASSLASQMKYQLLPVNDSATGHKFYVLVEDSNVNRGWGSYFFVAEPSPVSSPRVTIEAPHPVTDFNSQNIAYDIFLGAYPRIAAFILSGAERTYGPSGQTDMAHRTLSVFETANEVSATPGSIVIQIHSFAADRHPGYPMAVLSTGDGGTNGALQSIAESLSSSGITVGVFDGYSYESLGDQLGAQGRYVRAVGAGYVHAEISTTVVFNSTLIPVLENSFVRSINGGFRFPSYRIDLIIPAITLTVVAGVFFDRLRFSRSPAKRGTPLTVMMTPCEPVSPYPEL
ncbi:MAG TPA: hypothetical protein VGR56_05045 [Nitrososphaerales archaeon]|nr:hypothetical protein [Nitrososphaerales archaeon]